ncbi:MAG: DUF1297 domain-containing protein [Vulcanisaeta sp.]
MDSGATITPGLYGLINLATAVYDVAPRIGGVTNVYMDVGSPYSVPTSTTTWIWARG